MSEQTCKDCNHIFQSHYKSNDDKTHCIECNKNGNDCSAFVE